MNNLLKIQYRSVIYYAIKFSPLYKLLNMRTLTLLLGLMLSNFILVAQNTQKNYTVNITDSKTGTPIPNASVKLKATSKGGSTSESGSIIITAKPGDMLLITSIGYASQEVKLATQIFFFKFDKQIGARNVAVE